MLKTDINNLTFHWSEQPVHGVTHHHDCDVSVEHDLSVIWSSWSDGRQHSWVFLVVCFPRAECGVLRMCGCRLVSELVCPARPGQRCGELWEAPETVPGPGSQERERGGENPDTLIPSYPLSLLRTPWAVEVVTRELVTPPSDWHSGKNT